MKQYIFNLLMAIDQLGNAIAGGDPDVSVSGRIGYNSFTTKHWYWKLMERIVDNTFEPVDVPKHCYTTYLNDNDIDHSTGSTPALIALTFIAIPTCIVLWLPIRILAIFM